jgi:hypothetical protein
VDGGDATAWTECGANAVPVQAAGRSGGGGAGRGHRGAGALQGAVDGGWRGIQRLGGLGGVEAHHLDREERGALPWRQALQCGEEGEPDGVAAVVVGERREGRAPGDVGGRTALRAVGRGGAEIGRNQPARQGASGQRVEAARVAMACSQVESEARPSKLARCCQARSSVSCAMSSASAGEPSMR